MLELLEVQIIRWLGATYQEKQRCPVITSVLVTSLFFFSASIAVLNALASATRQLALFVAVKNIHMNINLQLEGTKEGDISGKDNKYDWINMGKRYELVELSRWCSLN